MINKISNKINNKIINKIKVMIIALLSMVIVTGCGANSPTEVVKTYFDEIKKGENSQATEYLLESLESTDESSKGDKEAKDEEAKTDPKLEEAMNLYFSKLDAKVLSEKIDKDKATVEVEVNGLNFSNIMLEILSETLSNAFSGEEMTDEKMNNSILQKVKSAKVETRTGTVTLSEVDKEWKIDIEDESFMQLLLGKSKDFGSNSAK